MRPHIYPPDITLRSGCESILAVIEDAQKKVANQVVQLAVSDDVGRAKGTTLVASYEAFRLDLRALLDHTLLQSHELRDRIVADIIAAWPGDVNEKLVGFCVDMALAKGL